MDVPLESSLSSALLRTNQPGQLAGRPLEEWNTAYVRVESYLHALRVRNKVLLGQLVLHVLDRALRRAPNESERSIPQLAAEEMDHVVTDWFAQVLQEPPTGADQMLSTRVRLALLLADARGRLALLLADMPGKWQDQFLRPGPWPEEFVTAMRATYLRAGPNFQLSQMTPRPLDLGPITTFTRIGRLPYAKMVASWIVFALLLVLIFVLTH